MRRRSAHRNITVGVIAAMVVGAVAFGVSSPASAGRVLCDPSTIDAGTFTGVTITLANTVPVTVDVRGRQIFVNDVRCARLPAQGTFVNRVDGTVDGRESLTIVMSSRLEIGGSGGIRFLVDLGSNAGARDHFTLRTLDTDARESVFPAASGVGVNDPELGTIASLSFNPATSSFLDLTLDARGGNDRVDGRGDQSGIFPVAPFAGRLTIRGGAGRDTLTGGANGDVIDGGADTDVIKAGPGDDRITARDRTIDRVNGGPGTDSCRCDPDDRRTAVER